MVKLQKGNLFNSLTGYYDFNLLNSCEYDLEINIYMVLRNIIRLGMLNLHYWFNFRAFKEDKFCSLIFFS